MRAEPSEFSRESIRNRTSILPAFLFFKEVEMRDGNEIWDEVPKEKKERSCTDEAMRLYRLIDSITAKGCDVEVKRVKGKFKIQTVRKSDSVLLD